VTNVTLFWGKEGLVGLKSQGHSDSKSHKGYDIVCAAVSTLIQALLVGLRDVAQVSEAECERDSSIPLICVKWPEEKALELNLLTRTVALSLKEVASGHSEHVSIMEVWVS